MNLPDFYQPSTVTSIEDPLDKGRVKITFQKTGVEYQDWVSIQDSFFSKEDNGWHGELAVGDEVLVAFIDWPTCQKPFVDKKIRSKQNAIARDGKEFLRIKGHKIEFQDSKVIIQHSNGNETITLNNGDIEVKNGSAASGVVLSMSGNKFKVANGATWELVSLTKELINILQTASVMTSLGPQVFIAADQTKLTTLVNKIQTFI